MATVRPMVGDVASHVVRHHRRLRGGLARFGALVDTAAAGQPDQVRHTAARQAVAFLDREVLAHADVEDALIGAVCRHATCHGHTDRLGPSHDTLREASAHLHALADEGDPVRAAGVLAGTRTLLHSHLEDEWRELLPLLGRLDPDVAEDLHDRFDLAGGRQPSGRQVRTWLATDLSRATSALTHSAGAWHRSVAAAVEHAVERAAAHQRVPLGAPQVTVQLVPAVTGEHVTLFVGRLRSGEVETVLAPVDFEITLVRAGSDTTTLEMHHTLVPTRPLPDDVPAHDLTAVAVHALVGELAQVSHAAGAAA